MKHFFYLIVFLLNAEISFTMPVILDTDMGNDIEDSWALGYILCSDELDLKLVLTDTGDTEGKARLVAKFLERVGRTDVSIGIGEKQNDTVGPQNPWASDYELSRYPGEVHRDGIDAIAGVVKNATDSVMLIVTGPCPNIPIFLQRYPNLVRKIQVVASSGSIRKGYDGVVSPDAEYNVRSHVAATRALYNAQWNVTIAPLDTSAEIRFSGMRYQKLINSQSLVFQTIRDAYRTWNREGNFGYITDSHSSVLYDLLPVYLGYGRQFCVLQEMKLMVNDYGFTRQHARGSQVQVAIEWKDRDAFLDHVIQRLSSGVLKAHFPLDQ